MREHDKRSPLSLDLYDTSTPPDHENTIDDVIMLESLFRFRRKLVGVVDTKEEDGAKMD